MGTAVRYLLAVLVVVAAVAAAALGAARPARRMRRRTGKLRIVSLAPNVTEILFALGLGDNIVGATDQLRLSAGGEVNSPRQRLRHAQRRNAAGRLAGHGHRLRPGKAGDPRGLAAVRRPRGGRAAEGFIAGFPELFDAIRAIGEATGRTAEAEALVARMETELQAVAARVAAIEEVQRPRVFVEIDKSPLMTAGAGSFIDDLIARAGGRNVAHEIQTAYPRIDPERVIAWNPEVILVAHGDAPGEAAKRLARQIGWSNVAAVRQAADHRRHRSRLAVSSRPAAGGGRQAIGRAAEPSNVLLPPQTGARRLRPARGAAGGGIWPFRSPSARCTLSWSELWSNTAILEASRARSVMAPIVGAGLSVAGAIFQALLRNPLAEPYVLGVTAGAGVGAALAIVAGITAAGAWTVPGMAFAGALGTIFLVQALARTPDGAVPVETMLLAGVTVSAVLNSLLMFIVSVAPSEKLHGVVWWLLGNLQVDRMAAGGGCRRGRGRWGWPSPSFGPAI